MASRDTLIPLALAAVSLMAFTGCAERHSTLQPTARPRSTPSPSASVSGQPSPSAGNPYAGAAFGVVTVTPYATPPALATSGDVTALLITGDGRRDVVPLRVTNHGHDAAGYHVRVRVSGDDPDTATTLTFDSGLLRPGGSTLSSQTIADDGELISNDPHVTIEKVTRTPAH